MFPDNQLLQLTLPRVTRALSRVQSLVWTEIAPVACSFAGSQAEQLTLAAAQKLPFKPVHLPFHWGRIFDVGWFKLDLPQVATKVPVYLHWNDQGEGTAYLDGVPFYGFEMWRTATACCPRKRKRSTSKASASRVPSGIRPPRGSIPRAAG